MRRKMFLTILLVSIISNAFSVLIEPHDTIIKSFYPNNSIKTIKTYTKLNNETIPNGSFVEYYKNGQVKDSCCIKFGINVGERLLYSSKGFVKAKIDYGRDIFPRKVIITTYYKSGACRMNQREITQLANHKQANETVSKYYWKSGCIMDSVLYKNNIVLFRARFYEDGKIDFIEKYPENAQKGDTVIVIGYLKDGTIKYSRTEIKGKGGY